MTRHLWLVGLMGAGKSTVGKHLADRRRIPFVDIDTEITTATGASIADLWTQGGEPAFRDHEQDAIAVASTAETPSVIATGGGAVLRTANIDVMRRTGVVVWLTAPVAELATRIGADTHRPLLDGADVEKTLTDLLAARTRNYRDAAHHLVETGGLTIDATTDTLEALWLAT